MLYLVQSAVLLLLLFLVAPFWNIQLKHKPFNWHYPIQCCKMKISKMSNMYRVSKIYDIFKNIVIFSIPGFVHVSIWSSGMCDSKCFSLRICLKFWPLQWRFTGLGPVENRMWSQGRGLGLETENCGLFFEEFGLEWSLRSLSWSWSHSVGLCRL